MNWALYALAAVVALGSLMTINSIGKPRKPMEADTAAFVVLINAAVVVLAILAAMRLS